MTTPRLFGAGTLRMSGIMRALLAPLLLTTLCLATPAALAAGQAPKPAAKPAAGPKPKSIGVFGDWQAATLAEGGQTVCYAFTRAKTSSPAVPGRGEVVLTITQRSSVRDAVAISAGFEYAANAAVQVEIDKDKLEFYTAKRSAFARDGRQVAVAMEKANRLIAHSPHPQKNAVTDTFSLSGFTKAYEAINKACPK
jgi:invasion protein IalB